MNLARAGAVIVVATLWSCSNQGSSGLLPGNGGGAKLADATVQVQFNITIPQPQLKYISPGTKSATIAVNGASTIVNCTTTCSASVAAPIGSDTFALALYDAAGATGHILSQGTLTQTIVANQANNVDVSFSGVISSLTITDPNVTFGPGLPSVTPLAIIAKDASGNTIVGSYTTAITVTDNDTSGGTQFSVGSGPAGSSATVSDSSSQINLKYNGSGNLPSSLVLTAAAPSVTSATLTINTPLGACTTQHSSTGASILGLYPCDLRNAYNVNTAAGSGQTVAIVDAYDYPNAAADLAVYRSAFGLPPCTTASGCFGRFAVNGVAPPVDPTGGWEGEAALDIEMVSALCPNCHIALVEARSPSNFDLQVAEQIAGRSVSATEISNSFGGPESSSEIFSDQYYNYPGIPVTASSGDNDYGEGVSYPAASPYVTAVGGTSLNPSTTPRGWTETVWNNNSVARPINQGSGSGCSAYEAKPTWQKDTACTKRMVADLSANADPNTGVAVYATAPGGTIGWRVVGGTSESAPLVAAIYAISGNGSSIQGGSYPYLNASQFNDVTVGDNLGSSLVNPTTGLTALPCTGATLYYCTAGVGYDGPTGMGTPNGINGLTPLALTAAGSAKSVRSDASVRIAPLRYAPRHRLCKEAQPGFATCFAVEVDVRR